MLPSRWRAADVPCAACARAAQHKARNSLRITERELLRDEAAERCAQDVCPFDVEHLQQTGDCRREERAVNASSGLSERPMPGGSKMIVRKN
jgi:hypothetical protein